MTVVEATRTAAPAVGSAVHADRSESGGGVVTLFTALAFLLFLIPGRFVLAFGVGSAGMPSVILGMLALLLWLLAHVHPEGRLAPGAQPMRMLLWAFLLAGFVSWAWAYRRTPLLHAESAGANRQLLFYVSLIGIGLLLADGLVSVQSLRTVVDAVLVGGYFSAIVGVVQKFAHYDIGSLFSHVPGLALDGDLIEFFTNRGGRANGTATHAIEFAVVCASLVALAIHRSRFARTAGARQLHTVGAFLLGAGAFLSVSRGGAIGVAIALVAYGATLTPRDRVNLLGWAVVGMAMVEVAAPSAISTIRYLLTNTSSDPSVQGRTSDYAAVSPIIDMHQWMGIGLGTFRPEVYRILDNQYLATLIEGGIVGLTVLILFFVISLLVTQQARFHAHGNAEARDLGQALFCGILVLGVSAALFDEFSFRQSTTLLFLLVGLAGAYFRLVREGADGWMLARPGREVRSP